MLSCNRYFPSSVYSTDYFDSSHCFETLGKILFSFKGCNKILKSNYWGHDVFNLKYPVFDSLILNFCSHFFQAANYCVSSLPIFKILLFISSCFFIGIKLSFFLDTVFHKIVNLCIFYRFSSRVFLLGPSHHYYTPKCALSRCSVYSTPLGDLPVDVEGTWHKYCSPCIDIIEGGLFLYCIFYGKSLITVYIDLWCLLLLVSPSLVLVRILCKKEVR